MSLLAPPAPSAFVNRRRFERFSLRPMYTAVSLRRRSDDASSRLDGHAYDIGEGGVNVEIDEPIVAGEPIEIEIELPGCSRRIAAQGRVFDAKTIRRTFLDRAASRSSSRNSRATSI